MALPTTPELPGQTLPMTVERAGLLTIIRLRGMGLVAVRVCFPAAGVHSVKYANDQNADQRQNQIASYGPPYRHRGGGLRGGYCCLGFGSLDPAAETGRSERSSECRFCR